MLYSWYLSYPLNVVTVDDVLFNHVSILYWISLPLMLTSLFLIGITFKNTSYKWIISVGIFIALYSLSFFFVMLSGSDSQYFRGFNEYFIETKNLNPLQPNHWYYQWPSFFILSYVSTSVSGLSLTAFEFLLYTVIGFLVSVSLHFYASRTVKTDVSRKIKAVSFIIIPAFVISMYNFLNYQCVPFSLALGLLFLIFMIETFQKSSGLTVVVIILFLSISITHVFVPIFLILYLLIRTIIERKRHYGNLFLISFVVFLLIQITFAQYGLAKNILRVLESSLEYSIIISRTLSPVSSPIDIIAQMFSRIATLAFITLCGIGFLFLLMKRKLKPLDKAILITGIIYSGLGVFFSSLGWRAIILAFIPVSLGFLCFFERKSRMYLKYVFSVLIIVLLVLFTFVPLHHSFSNSVNFQTIEAHRTDNFLIEHYKLEDFTTIYAGFRVITYLQSRTNHTNLTPRFEDGREAEIVLYTVELGKALLNENYTMEKLFSEKMLCSAYNNGYSFIAVEAR